MPTPDAKQKQTRALVIHTSSTNSWLQTSRGLIRFNGSYASILLTTSSACSPPRNPRHMNQQKTATRTQTE